MFELYKSEMLRLRKGKLITLLGLLIVYGMLPRLGLWDILHRNMGLLLTMAFVGLSLAFGLLHALLWKKKNFWVFLIHRPLSPTKIYLSLLGAGATVLVLTVFVSLLATTVSYDLFSAKVVDFRHYQYALYITLLGLACYMVGTLSVLHRSKFAILIFYPLFIVFFPEPRNMLAQYLPLLVLLAALFYLNIQCFKPDLKQPIKSPFGIGLMATGVSYSLVVALILATMLTYHFPMMIFGKHPDMNPP